MSIPKQRRRRMPEYQELLSWYSNAAVERFTKHAATYYVLQVNHISTVYPRFCSAREQIVLIAAQSRRPIPIQSISPSSRLDKARNPREEVVFGPTAKFLDDIAADFNMQWWITDQGLNVDFVVVQPDVSGFVAIAGGLLEERLSTDRRLKAEDLLAIARVLDENEFPLFDNMQLAFRKKLAEFNKEHPKAAVKTFQQAVKHPQLGRRAVQKALYSAREKLLRAKGHLV